MVAKVLGNAATTYATKKQRAAGVGGTFTGDLNLDLISMVANTAGDTLYVPYSSVVYSGNLAFNLAFQSTVSVEISYTLLDPGVSCNQDPDVQAEIPWVSTQTVAPGEIVPADTNVFAAMRVVFSGPGELYAAAK